MLTARLLRLLRPLAAVAAGVLLAATSSAPPALAQSLSSAQLALVKARLAEGATHR